ncbi:transcriptional regulator, LysR family [Paenibacillus curdlanolyticus YK9]|uniref:Transcriptional regulator, LysR family n=1 Tax=Paenibacillus curdlanolyticus YK9 TaxID=717606 RepID=E0IFW9_9BACL|nr:LysR family transcriptional regulator [Paenibacillus curdlanolyticus]EFM08549.1 transcriptional regulator, LysR family [Paenibacillus curdlanolyticus YK9]
MDLKTLKTFNRIVKYASFHRAAEEMNYAQSTVTMQIQRLEADLGVQLIERGKKVALTEAGKLFYEQSLAMVERMEQLQANLADLQLGDAGTVRIGLTEPTASYRMPQVLKRFMDEYPKIRIAIEIASTPVLMEALKQGSIDFALCSAPDVGKELYFQPLFHERFMMLMPEGHPLASLDAIALSDLEGHRLLITSAACPYRKKLEMMLQEAGHLGVETMEIGSMIALQRYVAQGMGVALVPRILVDPLPSGTEARPMKGSSIDMLMGLASRTSALQFASAKLYRYVKQELEVAHMDS